MATTSLASQLRLAIARTHRRLRQEGGGLPASQHAALISIERFGPLTPSELAAHERIQRPTATRLIGRLEDAGLVTRTADPQDGRSTLIAVTPAAREFLGEVRHARDAYLEERLATLSVADRATLQRAAGILEGLFEDPSAGPPDCGRVVE